MAVSKEDAWLIDIELDDIHARLRWALNNIDSLDKRKDVTAQLEVCIDRLALLRSEVKGEK